MFMLSLEHFCSDVISDRSFEYENKLPKMSYCVSVDLVTNIKEDVQQPLCDDSSLTQIGELLSSYSFMFFASHQFLLFCFC